MENLLRTLKRDFDSCQLPDAYDPMTIKTLSEIAEKIIDEERSISVLEDFLIANKMGYKPGSTEPYFGNQCYAFVENVLMYIRCKRGWR